MKLLFYSLLLIICISIQAQNLYHPHSFYRIKNSDILWHRTVWRTLNFNYGLNKAFYQYGNELTSSILENALTGNVKIYKSDELDEVYCIPDLKAKLKVPQDSTANYSGRDLYEIEVREEYIFDKNESRLKIEIRAFNVYLPANHPDNPFDYNIPLGSFSFKELSKNALLNEWKPSPSYHGEITFLDAFCNRYFDGDIVKVDNYENEYLIDQARSEEEANYAAQEIEENIRAYEYNLWETNAMHKRLK